MTIEGMTEQAALVLTEWIHTLARELSAEPEPLSLQRVTEVAVRCCPETASACNVADTVLAAETARHLHPDLLIRDAREAVRRLEQALPEALSESQREGYFSLLLTGLAGDASPHGLDRADGGELRERLSQLLEEQTERILEDMADLASSGAAGLEPAPPEPLEGVLSGRQIPILAAAVFCTVSEGLLDELWQWSAMVGISLAVGEQLVPSCVPGVGTDARDAAGEFCRLSALQEGLRGIVLLALAAFCLQIFVTGGGELDVMGTLLAYPEEWPVVLGRQLYGLLGHASGYGATGGQAKTVIQQVSAWLCAYRSYLDAVKGSAEHAKEHEVEQTAQARFWHAERNELKQIERKENA